MGAVETAGTVVRAGTGAKPGNNKIRFVEKETARSYLQWLLGATADMAGKQRGQWLEVRGTGDIWVNLDTKMSAHCEVGLCCT